MATNRLPRHAVSPFPAIVPPAELGFLRRVYALFSGGIAFAALGAVTALYWGARASTATTLVADRVVVVPPLVAWFAEHWIVATLLYFGAFFATTALRRTPRVNVVALFGFTFLSGLYVAPLLFVAMLLGTAGQAMTANPVRDAFLLALAEFGGLTTYVLVTKKDFSYLRGFLTMGILVLLGAMVLGIFVGGDTLQLAIASAGVLLFGGYVLYDTSRILHAQERTDAVGAAIALYLDFLNVFLFVLRILMSRRRR